MTIALLILAIIIGYLRKGRLKNLANLEIKLAPIFILSFIIQIAIFIGNGFDIGAIQSYQILLHFVSYIILFAGLMGNLNSKWFICITVGVTCNFLVIFLNGGKMPVSIEAASVIGISVDHMKALLSGVAGIHQELQDGALLWYLSDIIPISFPGPLQFLGNIFSVGDFIMYAGLIGLIQSAMVHYSKEQENEELPLNEIAPVRELNSFKAENHMDEIYMSDIHEKDCFSLRSQEESIVLNFDQVDNKEVAAVNTVEEIGLMKEVERFKQINKDKGEDNIFSFNNTLDSDVQAQELFHERNNNIQQIEESHANEFTEEETQPKEIVTDEVDFDEGVVDTIHQYIIVDGKIKENEHYNKNQTISSVMPVEEPIEIENRVNKLEDQVEELEMTQVELSPKVEKEETDNQHLVNVTDSERIDLIEQIKQRKEKGYSLVEVEVGNKKINFWKKDL